MFGNNKRHFITVVIMVMVLIFALNASAAAASPIVDLLSSYFRSFRHVGTVDHEHSFSSAEGAVRFAAEGQGLVGGSHDAWARDGRVQSILNSMETYICYTDRIAASDQHMRMISRYGLSRDNSAITGMMLKPNEIGRIDQTVSAKSEPGVGHYFKSSNSVKTTDGTTVIQRSVGNSVTNIEVEGYTEYREVVVVESGGVKTGWWDLN